MGTGIIGTVDIWIPTGDGIPRVCGMVEMGEMAEARKRNDSVVDKMKVPYQGRDDHRGLVVEMDAWFD